MIHPAYKPGSILTYHKELFASFSVNGITYQYKHFKHYMGSFVHFWKLRFALTMKNRPKYGVLKNRAAWGEEEENKL